jgi:ATP-binding cassette subfamily C protein
MLFGYFKLRATGSPLTAVIESCKGIVTTLGIMSGVINVLTLTGSIFMMQVYDRVLGSQSLPTLVALSVIAVAAYVFLGFLESLRGRILTLVGEKLDADLAPSVHEAGLKLSLASPQGQQDSIQVFRDLEAIRTFVTGQGLVAALDMPWVLLYIAMATLLHPWFGATTAVAALLLIWLTWLTEKNSRAPVKEAYEASSQRNGLVEANMRQAEAMLGNGMRADRIARWAQVHQRYLVAQRTATYTIGGYSAAAKSVRLLLQSFVLAVGAYLAIKGQISAGAIIAASIIVARALAPIDQAIASWRPFTAARDGHDRLTRLLSRLPPERDLFQLAPPKATLAVKDLAIAPPGAQQVTMAGATFTLRAGQMVGIIGPSMSGKSSLVKGLVGVWKPVRGSIAFDGAGPEQWTEEALGRAMGYLPQDVQLFEGTIAENIARFAPNVDTPEVQAKVQAAARAAGLDNLIRSEFPKTGYNHTVGPNGAGLAGGLRQRIGLARALYGDPFLLVLDEPNSNLDEDGELALGGAIRAVKARGGIVVCVSHRPAVLNEADVLLSMVKGQPEFFGPRDDVLKRWLEKHRAGASKTPRNAAAPGAPPAPVGGVRAWSAPPIRVGLPRHETGDRGL